MLTYIYYCIISSHKQETITSSIESLMNVLENCVMTDEGDISNYLGVNVKKTSDGTFKLLLSHLVEKIINHVGITVFAGLKSREMPDVKFVTA